MNPTVHAVFLRSQDDPTLEIPFDGNDVVEWNFQIGGEAAVSQFRVSSDFDAELSRVFRTTAFDLVYQAPGEPEVVVKDVWVTQRVRNLGPSGALWRAADKRWWVGSKMVDTLFNGMRTINDVTRPGDLVPANVAIFTQVPKKAFIPPTCKSPDDEIRFHSPDDEDFQPWTALQALKWMVSDEGWLATLEKPPIQPDGTPFSFGDVLISNKVRERKILLKRWNPKQHWRTAIASLQREARVGVYVNEDGRFVIEDLEVINSITQGYGLYRGSGGVPATNSLALTAPRVLNYHFPKYYEIRWEYDEVYLQQIRDRTELAPGKLLKKGPGLFQPGDTFWLENVVRIPQDIEGWKAGQWVEIGEALEAWKKDPDRQPLGALGAPFNKPQDFWSFEALRKFMVTTAYAHVIQRDPRRPNFKDEILEGRVATLYQSYRQIFRIPEAWMDHIEDIKAKTGVISDAASRLRQPSPVYVDYSTWDSFLFHKSRSGSPRKQGKGTGHLQSYPLATSEQDPFQKLLNPALKRSIDLRIDDMTRSPAKVKWLDRAQGVFEVEFPKDLTGATLKYQPGLYTQDSLTQIAPRLPNNVVNAARRQFDETFRLVVILSIRFRSPNSARKFATIEIDGRQFLPYPPLGPEADRMYGGFEAFKRHEDFAVSWGTDPKTGHLVVDHRGEYENLEILSEIAYGEANREYYAFIPRRIGTFRAKGWTGQGPIGQVRRTRLLFQGGRMETELNAETPPARPTIWEFLSPSTRNIVARFENDTELDP